MILTETSHQLIRKTDLLYGTYFWAVIITLFTQHLAIIAKNKVIVPTTGGTFFVISIDSGEVL